MVLGEQGLDEDARFLVVPHAAHGAGSGVERRETADGTAKVGEGRICDHRDSERDGARNAVKGRRALVGPMTTGLSPV
jgi:hypothetical protein